MTRYIYTMKCGETLRKLCDKFGYDLSYNMKINPGVHPDRYYTNRVINLESIHGVNIKKEPE